MKIANDNYSVERRHGCFLVYGSITLDAMNQIVSTGGQNLSADVEAARMTGANMVVGSPINLLRLRNSLNAIATTP